MRVEIVARQPELAEVERLLGDAGKGPAALILEGEAGIGKTTVWKEGVAAAERRGERLLVARPSASEAELSFSALGDLLAEALAEPLGELSDPQRHALEVALRLRDPGGRAPDALAIGLAVLSSLRIFAGERPLLLAIDDLQWVDTASAGALEFALRRLEGEPVRLLATVRSGERGALAPALERGVPEGRFHSIEIGPLSLGALHQLLRHQMATALHRPLLLRVHQVSGGNPFFALEIARALRKREVRLEPGAPLPVPESLHALVRGRVMDLPAEARVALLVVASAATPSVTLVQAAGSSRETLEPALEASVIEVEGGRIRFTHPLLASAVYSDASPFRRRELHRRLAAIVGDAEERARHAALAAEGPDDEIARTLEEAARVAAARGAPDAAAELAEHAVRLTPENQVGPRGRRKNQAAGYHETAGAYDRAVTILEELAVELPAGGERADVLRRLADARDDDYETRVRLLEEALSQAGSSNAVVADINSDLWLVAFVRGSFADAGRFAQTAHEAAERIGDRTRVAGTLTALGLTQMWETGEVEPNVLERALALENEGGHLSAYSEPRMLLGLRAMYRDELSAARAYLTAGSEAAGVEGNAAARSAYLLHLAELECRACRWREAALHAEEDLELEEQMGFPQPTSGALYVTAKVDAHLGRADQARAAAEKGLALSEEARDWIFTLQNQSVLGFLELSLGDASAAARRLAPLHDPLGEPSISGILPNAIEALIALGELDEARPLLERLEERGTALDRAWALATGARCRGLLTAAEGDPPSAFAAFEHALAEHERLPVPFEHARTLLALGSVQRRAQQKRAARETLEQALEIFERLGTPLWAEKARVELGRIGGRRAARAGALTATEAAIAELVATGRTNEEVAEALSLSPRTVQWNLSKVYRKLGVRSRTELAATVSSPDNS